MAAEHVVVSSTTDSEEAARRLADGAIGASLGACAQIVGPITSVYRWEGEVQADQVPEIIATPITGGSAEYLAWLVAETRV